MTKAEQVFRELSRLYELGHEIELAGLNRVSDVPISVEERLADRDYPALTDRELSRLLAEARAKDNSLLRRLIKHHVALREAADRMLRRLKEVDGEGDDLVRVAEHFVHADWKRLPDE